MCAYTLYTIYCILYVYSVRKINYFIYPLMEWKLIMNYSWYNSLGVSQMCTDMCFGLFEIDQSDVSISKFESTWNNCNRHLLMFSNWIVAKVIMFWFYQRLQTLIIQYRNVSSQKLFGYYKWTATSHPIHLIFHSSFQS